MAYEIVAAAIQAIPVAGAALVGWRGLSTWRTQLREGRRIEHAEKALATAAPMFGAIRVARSQFATLPATDAADPAELRAALRRDIEERLNRAWGAFENFQERYVLAGLYDHKAKRQMDVAGEVGACLLDLSRHARMMLVYEDIGERELTAKERAAFYGSTNPLSTQDDSIEDRLKRAEQALQDELRPILTPKARGGHLSHHILTAYELGKAEATRRGQSLWARLRAVWPGQ